MSQKADSMRTPLGRVRGLGAAKSGLSHWWHQRLTAIAMVPLMGWMIWLVLNLAGASYRGEKQLAGEKSSRLAAQA